jgi:hypothetical protein
VLGGKLGYFWWSATGDDFNVKGTVARPLVGFATRTRELCPDKTLEALAERVVHQARNRLILVANKGFTINVAWNELRRETDLFDSELLRLNGLGDQWRPLNVWYRQNMRSSGAGGKVKSLPWDEFVRSHSFPQREIG